MTKQELREQLFAIYRKVYHIDEKPDMIDLARLANVLAQAIERCSDAERELGTEVYNLIKRCTKVKIGGVDVYTTKLLDEIAFYESN